MLGQRCCQMISEPVEIKRATHKKNRWANFEEDFIKDLKDESYTALEIISKFE